MDLSEFLNHLYEEYHAGLFYYALSLLKSEVDAEEALQNLFLGLVSQKQKIRQIQQIKSYLFTGVRLESLKLLRSKSRYDQKLEDFGQISRIQPIPESPYGEAEALQLEKALEELPSEQKEVLVLKNFSQLTFQEIAQITETSPDTVASRYRYGLQKLSQKFQKPSFNPVEVE